MEEFIDRVEYRSSLLMMSGHDIENGRLVEFFEFRHLTFQEFLTARAMVEGWHPGREESDTLVTVLEPHFEKEEWQEVIPLAAVLGGKATEALIQHLTGKVSELNAGAGLPYSTLINCLVDEAAARPQTIRAAMRALIRRMEGETLDAWASDLALGRYGKDLREEARRAFLLVGPEFGAAQSILADIVWALTSEETAGYFEAAERFLEWLGKPDVLDQCEGALGLMVFFYKVQYDSSERVEYREFLLQAGNLLLPLLFTEEETKQSTSAWALAWLGSCRVWQPPAEPDLLGRLFNLWQKSPSREVRYLACWALATQPLVSRDNEQRCVSIDHTDLENLLRVYEALDEDSSDHSFGTPQMERVAVLVTAWYLRSLDDKELVRRASALREKGLSPAEKETLQELLGHLDEGCRSNS